MIPLLLFYYLVLVGWWDFSDCGGGQQEQPKTTYISEWMSNPNKLKTDFSDWSTLKTASQISQCQLLRLAKIFLEENKMLFGESNQKSLRSKIITPTIVLKRKDQCEK